MGKAFLLIPDKSEKEWKEVQVCMLLYSLGKTGLTYCEDLTNRMHCQLLST